MTKYLDKSFSVHMASGQSYRDNWDAIFGRKDTVGIDRDFDNLMKDTPSPAAVADVAETLGDTMVCQRCGGNVQDHVLSTVDGMLLVYCPIAALARSADSR